MSVPRSSATAAHEAVPGAPTPPPRPYADAAVRERELAVALLELAGARTPGADTPRAPAVDTQDSPPDTPPDTAHERHARGAPDAAHEVLPQGASDAAYERPSPGGPDAARQSAPGGCHPLPAGLAVRAGHRLASDGRRGETAALLADAAALALPSGPPFGPASGTAPHGHSGAHAAVLRQAEHELGEGPATDTLRTGAPVPWLLLDGAGTARWPRYGPVAREAGMRAVLAVPLPGEGVGCGPDHRSATDQPPEPAGVLVVHLCDEEPLDAATHAALGSLAEACALGLAHQAALRRADELQQALSSRIVIEQAKGMLAERRHSTPEEAFRTLRAYARSRRRALHQVARDLVEDRLAGPPFDPSR
ncbi:ANTAR domain-containing protein [Streptomyces sp. PU-14G]|uniref:ANTAR domain-containing protein n=1 Tax=Streptomyces sp. PU-14G TaxID=2800808 RepID=UPI0034DF67FA